VADEKTVQIIQVDSGQTTPITISSSGTVETLLFGADDSILIVAYGGATISDGAYTAFDLSTGDQLYTQGSYFIYSDGQSFVITAGRGYSSEFRDIVSNELLSTRGSEEDAVNSGFITPSGYERPYYVNFRNFLNDNKQALVVYSENIIPSRFGVYDLETHTPVYILPQGEDVSALKELYDGPFASPDNTTFTVLWPDGGLELFDMASGDSLASSDRFTISSKVTLSPDGSLFAWSTYQGINVYNLQTGEYVMQVEHPKLVLEFGTLSFVGQSKLLVSTMDAILEQQPWGMSETPNLRTYVWDLASGQLDEEHLVLYNCQPQGSSEQYMKCAVFDNLGNYAPDTLIGTSVLDIGNPENVVVSGGSEAFLAGSPSDDGFTLCKEGAPGIAIKEGSGPSLNLEEECQPFFYAADGDAISLFLQNGKVIDVATGETRLQLDVDESGIAFESEFTLPRKAPDWFSYEPYYSGVKPRLLSGDGFIVIGDRIFDSQSGALLFHFSDNESVIGAMLEDDGKTLLLLTNRGLERWQVLQ
jgi:hypothetical protein